MTDSSAWAPGRAAASAARRPTALLVGSLLTVGLFLLPASPGARAHDGLVRSVPAADAAVPTAPSAVQLEFSAPPVPLGTQVVVTGPDGAAVSEGPAGVQGTTVVQPLAGSLPAGRYSVRWRSASADGHPVTGSWSFTAAAGADPAASAPAGEPAEPTVTARPAQEGAPVGWIAAGALGLGGAAVLLHRRLRGRA